MHLSAGFDFLGFNVRRYGATLLIKPSAAAIQRIRERLRTEMRALRGSTRRRSSPRSPPSSGGGRPTTGAWCPPGHSNPLDNYLWTLTYKWATRGHPNKPKTWVCARYFGKFNKFRNDHWAFGDAASGAYLIKFSWTDIVRHIPVTGGASPDDPALAEYWAARRRRIKPPLDSYTLHLLDRQDGRCPLCGDPRALRRSATQSPQEWESWWLPVTRKAIARLPRPSRTIRNPAVRARTHPPRTRHLPTRASRPPPQEHSTPPCAPQGLLELPAGKAARTVLRGDRRSNAPGLPD